MGGFTAIYLKDKSEKNIKKQNEILSEMGVAKNYRFYSEADILFEYESFCKGEGEFRECLFPKDKIHSLKDFKKYWNPKALGESFVPYVGSLTFDCYFGRTSKRTMRKLGQYITFYNDEIESVSGSWETFMERGMTKIERKIFKESGIKEQW